MEVCKMVKPNHPRVFTTINRSVLPRTTRSTRPRGLDLSGVIPRVYTTSTILLRPPQSPKHLLRSTVPVLVTST
jgi:hypothetical protein